MVISENSNYYWSTVVARYCRSRSAVIFALFSRAVFGRQFENKLSPTWRSIYVHSRCAALTLSIRQGSVVVVAMIRVFWITNEFKSFHCAHAVLSRLLSRQTAVVRLSRDSIVYLSCSLDVSPCAKVKFKRRVMRRRQKSVDGMNWTLLWIFQSSC